MRAIALALTTTLLLFGSSAGEGDVGAYGEQSLSSPRDYDGDGGASSHKDASAARVSRTFQALEGDVYVGDDDAGFVESTHASDGERAMKRPPCQPPRLASAYNAHPNERQPSPHVRKEQTKSALLSNP